MTDDVQRTVGSLAAIATELATLSTNLQTAEVLGQMQADRATLRELLTAARRALAPFAHFARQFARKPLSGMDDAIYGIHTGTEWAAELRRSDCQRAADLLGVIEQTLSPAVQSHQRVPDGAVARTNVALRAAGWDLTDAHGAAEVLLTDLRHWCKARGVSMAEVLRSSRLQFEEERTKGSAR
jgi:hypothetical protein